MSRNWWEGNCPWCGKRAVVGCDGPATEFGIVHKQCGEDMWWAFANAGTLNDEEACRKLLDGPPPFPSYRRARR